MSLFSRSLLLLVLALCLLVCSAQTGFDGYSAYEDVDLYLGDDSADSPAFSLYSGEQLLPALTRPALYKQRPTVTERVAIPVLLSSTRTTNAAPIVQKTLTETRPTFVQAVKPHSTFTQLAPITEAAAVPFLQSSTTTQKAAPIVQKTLMETRPEMVQAVKAHPTKETRPTVTEAVAVPFMQSSEQTSKAQPIVQNTLTETRPITIVQEAPAAQKK